MAVLSAAVVRAASAELRTLRTALGGFGIDLGTMRTDARTRLDEADAAWSGPRSERTVGAVRGYLERLDPPISAVDTITGALSALAAVGDTVAAGLDAVESARTHAAGLRASDDPESHREAAWVESRAHLHHASCDEAWLRACSTAAGTINGARPALSAFAIDNVLVGSDAASTTEYAFVVAQYSALTGIPIEEIDTTGVVAQAQQEWIELLEGTGIGALYYTILETANDSGDVEAADWNLSGGDLARAGSDPARLRELFVEWGELNGVEFEPATLNFLVAQSMAGAQMLAAGGRDTYKDIDDRIQERSPGGGGDIALAYISAAPPVVALNLAQAEGNPVVTNSWWRGLPSGDRGDLTANGPASLGNTDGIPAVTRDTVNRSELDELIVDLRDRQDAAEAGTGPPLTIIEEQMLDNAMATVRMIESHEDVVDPFTESAPTVQLYIFDPDAFGGDGRVAVSIGDIDTAEHVSVAVPGLSSDVTGMGPDKTALMYEEARWASGGETVAVIDWMGYDAPSYSTSDGTGGVDTLQEALDIAGVANRDAATAGAELLASDVAGINAMRPGDDPHLTVVGNSYGSTTSAIAADEFDLQADDLVLTGSPGAGNADHADDFSMGAEHTYVISGSTDIVSYLGNTGGTDVTDVLASQVPGVELMGNDPSEDDFGAVRLAGEYEGRNPDASVPLPGPWEIELPGDIDGHTHYYDAGTESLYNVAAVVGGVGDDPAQTVAASSQRHKDPAFETHSPINVDWDTDWWDWTPFVDDVDWSNEPLVEANLFAVDPEEDRTPQTELTHGPG